MAARQQVLDKTDLFGTLPPELLGQLRDRTALARLRRGDVIFEKGDPATSLYVVFSGRVAIAAKAADGRESVISVLGPGALFGEMSLFDGGVRSAHARALTTVHLIAVAFDDVREVLSHRPDVLWAVVRILARRLRATDEALADAMFLDVTGRTAKRLLALAEGEDYFRMPLTQEELAGMVGAVPRACQQGDRALREARLARDLRPEPVPHPRAHRARGARDQLGGAGSPSAQAIARSQHAAASAAWCTGRSGSCTKPWSPPSTTTISQSERPIHAARSASMSAAASSCRPSRRS